ncbi:hypothetical protein [Actinoallomurus sp. CA-142502]|uniref:hypothetical protein n=1 Tax=Actinoallomurus sp. CA-142502 TaxID=3239885 RepID=UPI003D907600
MRRPAAAVLTMLSLAGCGVRPSGVVYAGDAPVATAAASPRSQVYFLLRGVPTPVARETNPWDAQLVFDDLLRGPNAQERAKGMTTALTGIEQIAVRDIGGRAFLIDTVPPLPKISPAAYAQIYCTGLVLPDQPVLKFSSSYPGLSRPDCFMSPVPKPSTGAP